ncbi:MAG: type II secretion system protein GspD, partial [Desulfobacterales bacterium]
QINLEVTAIDLTATAFTSSTQPVTLKRTVDTTVIVRDNQTIVIGGLIDDTTTINESKVPVLGDVPILGWLFRDRSETKQKTNLYVFLTPRVIKNPIEAASVMQEKQGQIESVRDGSFKIKQRQPPETMENEPEVSE